MDRVLQNCFGDHQGKPTAMLSTAIFYHPTATMKTISGKKAKTIKLAFQLPPKIYLFQHASS
jgi:hypothetical protein